MDCATSIEEFKVYVTIVMAIVVVAALLFMVNVAWGKPPSE